MSSLYEEIQAVRGQFPEGSRSATIPALRLAQEQYGWLPPQAIREVADALDLTPAYCHAVASFYDMFHLEPVGEHLVEVCTNLSCALSGAQAVVEAFEQELGVRVGRTTRDGKVTFRAVGSLTKTSPFGATTMKRGSDICQAKTEIANPLGAAGT